MGSIIVDWSAVRRGWNAQLELRGLSWAVIAEGVIVGGISICGVIVIAGAWSGRLEKRDRRRHIEIVLPLTRQKQFVWISERSQGGRGLSCTIKKTRKGAGDGVGVTQTRFPVGKVKVTKAMVKGAQT